VDDGRPRPKGGRGEGCSPYCWSLLGRGGWVFFESGRRRRRRRNRLADYSINPLGFFAWSSPFRTAWFGRGALRRVSNPGSSGRDFSYSLMIELTQEHNFRPKHGCSSVQRRGTEQTGLHIHTAGTRNRCLLGDGPARRPQSWVESKKTAVGSGSVTARAPTSVGVRCNGLSDPVR
jgi:hypothetical protein